MGPLSGALVLSEEAVEHAVTPAWVFGATAFGVLMLLLVITLLINVDR